MSSLITALLLFSIAFVNCIQIPFIQNVTLIPRYKWNSTIITDQTCEQCLCISIPSFVAFNWFPNNTCQLFYTFPISYKIQSTSQARLYFPQRIFPNVSQCCMPDLAYLLDKLNNGTRTYANVSSPRNLLIDNNGYLVTVEFQPPKLDRFDAQTLSLIDQTTIIGSNAYAVGFFNNAYFVGFVNGPIVVIDSENLTVLNTISSSYIQGLRGIVFVDNGRTMAISTFSTNTIIFFHQTSDAPLNYTFAYQQSLNYVGVHGLTGYNVSCFYATSWYGNSVYSYNAVKNSTSWNETLVINASMLNNGNGAFVTIDECGRYWFACHTSVMYIFNNLGTFIGNFSLGSGTIFDILITENYVMYFSDDAVSKSQIIRIDPHIEC